MFVISDSHDTALWSYSVEHQGVSVYFFLTILLYYCASLASSGTAEGVSLRILGR